MLNAYSEILEIAGVCSWVIVLAPLSFLSIVVPFLLDVVRARCAPSLFHFAQQSNITRIEVLQNFQQHRVFRAPAQDQESFCCKHWWCVFFMLVFQCAHWKQPWNVVTFRFVCVCRCQSICLRVLRVDYVCLHAYAFLSAGGVASSNWRYLLMLMRPAPPMALISISL